MTRTTKQNGTVYLVGAGPGDLGLVTLRARECIENADVIVYDHLANPEMISWARDDAEIIYAGKEPGESPRLSPVAIRANQAAGSNANSSPVRE